MDLRQCGEHATQRRDRAAVVELQARAGDFEHVASGAALEEALHGAGAKDAKVSVKAGRVAGAARATIEIAVADLALLAKAARIKSR